MPAKNPKPLNRHQCHLSTLGTTKAGTSPVTIHLVTECTWSVAKPKRDAAEDDDDRGQVAEHHQPPRRRLRIEIALVDVVDDIGRAAVDRRDERAHERRQQAREDHAFEADGDVAALLDDLAAAPFRPRAAQAFICALLTWASTSACDHAARPRVRPASSAQRCRPPSAGRLLKNTMAMTVMPAMNRNRGRSDATHITRFSSAASRGLRVERMCWMA